MTGAPDDRLRRLGDAVALATFADGGLLLHLPSGDVFELDAATAAVWRAITTCETIDDAVERTRAALALPPGQARSFVEAAVAQVSSLGAARPPETYRIEDDTRTVALFKEGRPLLALERRTLSLTLVHRPDPARPGADEDDVAALIRLFVPKILVAWFPLAIHASALQVRGGAVLFAGASGAGKTTTARTLAEEIGGVTLLSEDIVLFAELGPDSTVVDGAEPIIRSWIDRTAGELSATPPAVVSVAPLGEALMQHRQRTPLRKIVFLEAAHRRGSAWSLRDLGHAQALSGLFLNSFLPSAAPAALRSHLESCRAVVASGARAQKAISIPQGIDHLRASGRLQSEMIAL